MKSMRLSLKNVVRVTGFVIFIAIILKINRSRVLELITSIDKLYLIISIILFLPQILFKAWRLQMIVQSQGVSHSIKDCFIVYAASMFVGIITPGKLGEFSRAFYLQAKNYPLRKSFASVLLDRLFDLFFIFLIAVIGFIIFMDLPIIYLYVFIVIAFLTFLIIFSKRLNLFVFLPEKYREVANDLNEFLKFRLSKTKLFLSLIATVATWLVYFTQIYLLSFSLGIPISYFQLALCISMSAVVSLVPITISGVGTRDATLLIVFSRIGLSAEYAIALSIIVLLIHIICGIIGAFAWFRRPLPIKIYSTK